MNIERQKIIALVERAPNTKLKTLATAVEAALSRRPVTHRKTEKTENGSSTLAGNSVTATCSQFKSSNRTSTFRRCKNGKPKLPRLPEGLRWPSKKYSNVHKTCTIEQFLRKEWLALIEAGYGELRWLRLRDPSAARAVAYFERFDASIGRRRQLPRELRFLTEKEVTDQKLANGLAAIATDPRLAVTLATRLRRGHQVPRI